MTDSQAENSTVADYIDCAYHALDSVFVNGGRNFVLMNLAPLHLAPLYATPENQGVRTESSYWPWKPENTTEVSYRMKEQVVALNQVFDYRTPYELLIARRYPEANFAVMNMYGLVSILSPQQQAKSDFVAIRHLLLSNGLSQYYQRGRLYQSLRYGKTTLYTSTRRGQVSMV